MNAILTDQSQQIFAVNVAKRSISEADPREELLAIINDRLAQQAIDFQTAIAAALEKAALDAQAKADKAERDAVAKSAADIGKEAVARATGHSRAGLEISEASDAAKIALNAFIAEMNAALAMADKARLEAMARADAAYANAMAAFAQVNAKADTAMAKLADIVNAPEHSTANSYLEDALVKSGSGLYHAKTAVPVGIAITNTAYWEYVGEYDSIGEALAASISMGKINATAISAEVSRLDALLARAPDGPLASQAAVLNEATARASAVGALSERLSVTDAKLSDPTAGLARAHARIAAEETARVNADSANASQITGLQASLSNQQTQLGTKASIAEVNTVQSNLDATNGTLTSLTSTVNAHTSSIANKAESTAVTAIETRVREAEGNLSTTSSGLTALKARVAEAESAIVNEIIVGAAKDDAHSLAITGLDNRLINVESGVGANASATSTMNTKVSTLQGQVTSHSSAITALQNSVTNLQNVYVQPNMPTGGSYNVGDRWLDSDDSNHPYMWDGAKWADDSGGGAQIFVQANPPAAGLGLNLNDLWFDSDDGYRKYRWTGSDWQNVDDARIAATASAVQTLTNTVDQHGSTLTSHSASITGLNNALTGKASTTALSGLSSTVTEQDGRIAANTNALNSLTSTVNNKAEASALSNLSTTVTQQGNTLSSHANSITSLNAAIGNMADAGAVSSLGVTVTNQDGRITANASAITHLNASVDGANGLVSQVATLSNKTGQLEGRIENKVTVGDRSAAIALVANAKEAGIAFTGDQFSFNGVQPQFGGIKIQGSCIYFYAANGNEIGRIGAWT